MEDSTQCVDLFPHTWLKRGNLRENPPGAGQPSRQSPIRLVGPGGAPGPGAARPLLPSRVAPRASPGSAGRRGCLEALATS